MGRNLAIPFPHLFDLPAGNFSVEDNVVVESRLLTDLAKDFVKQGYAVDIEMWGLSAMLFKDSA